VAALKDKVGDRPIEVWFCDEARVGQKNKITRRWAKRGTRPSAPKDQRTPQGPENAVGLHLWGDLPG